jgi:uncharacterized membrane protein
MEKTLLRFYLWGTLGLSTEIFFTAMVAMYHSLRDHTKPDWGLSGHTFVWMFFIYGSGALLFSLGYKHLRGFHLLLRIFLVAIVIFMVEFVTGFVLDKLTGHCPWQYTSRWNIMGYIRLDYLPVWMIFAYIIERADEQFEKMTKGEIRS